MQLPYVILVLISTFAPKGCFFLNKKLIRDTIKPSDDYLISICKNPVKLSFILDFVPAIEMKTLNILINRSYQWSTCRLLSYSKSIKDTQCCIYYQKKCWYQHLRSMIYNRDPSHLTEANNVLMDMRQTFELLFVQLNSAILTPPDIDLCRSVMCFVSRNYKELNGLKYQYRRLCMTPSSDLRLYKLYLSILPTCTANDIFSNPTWINAIIGDDNVANFLYVINIAKIVSRPFFIVQLPEEVVALVPCRLKIFLVSDPRSTGIRVRDNHRLFGAKSRML